RPEGAYLAVGLALGVGPQTPDANHDRVLVNVQTGTARENNVQARSPERPDPRGHREKEQSALCASSWVGEIGVDSFFPLLAAKTNRNRHPPTLQSNDAIS